MKTELPVKANINNDTLKVLERKELLKQIEKSYGTDKNTKLVNVIKQLLKQDK